MSPATRRPQHRAHGEPGGYLATLGRDLCGNPVGQQAACRAQGQARAVRQQGSNRPLRDVTVTVYEDQQVRLKAIVTDEDGSFGLGALKPGTYKVVFQKEGYRKVVREKVVVKTEGGIRLDVEMEESPYELSPSPFHFFRTDD